MSLLNTLFLAARPKTLTAGISPVLLGASLAWKNSGTLEKDFSFFLIAFVTLFTAVLIQILSNYVNDLYDFKKGSDTILRIGPKRALASGLISERNMELTIYSLTTIILLSGLFLVLHAGLPILLIGILSIIGAYAYTAGPFPLAHNGLGELFVLVFFGPVAVLGTEYVLIQQSSFEGLLLGISIGCLASSILVINNIRDLQEDQSTGKKTLAARFGKKFAHLELLFLLFISPSLLITYTSSIYQTTYNLALVTAITPVAAYIFLSVVKNQKGENYNSLLAYSGMYLFLFSLILSTFILL